MRLQDKNCKDLHSAPQNDCLNLSFVKDIHVFVKSIARNFRKTEIGVGM